MSLQAILGQPQASGILTRALESGRIANAYLFYGPESVGKKKAGYELAKALNCETLGPKNSCDQCSSCRRIDQGLHPDVFFLEPDASGSVREPWIKIEAIRDLQKKLAFMPYEGKTKVVVIDAADRINPQAANAFLKTLEEPPAETVLILITSNPQQLLPTVASRCQGIRFQPLSEPTLEIILKEITNGNEEFNKDEIPRRVSRSGGSVQNALDFDLEEWGQVRQSLIQLLLNLSLDRVDILFSFARTWAKSEPTQITRMLKEMSGMLRDVTLLQIQCSPELLFNRDLSSEIKPMVGRQSQQALAKMQETIHNTRLALKGNANVQLTLETMLLDFCEVR
ncbi:MAG: DNA polymerase III subunit delta' [Candidatus Nitronauta litoralis]|uniref:DNA polymerase III subunit delta' n=1 Tax=Candidatus Nitronauta litoralis TaxID=2705533 RepID=A0A7T0BY22_9BACT|nr:MAG: DNA polymerase III subunit delta' [Candidatus Nitronauta litoralis]